MMHPGTFAFRHTLEAGGSRSKVNIPIDCTVKPLSASTKELPVLIEAKSAGDATNTNKRRKEEAQKLRQLKDRYGASVRFVLFLCGYFEPGYLGYEAAEGIDWFWEHRLNDLKPLLAPESKKKTNAVCESQVTYDRNTLLVEEGDRAEAQGNTDALKNAAERNKLGQFSTPFGLARQMTRHALTFLPQKIPVCFLEPAIGSGVFFSALRCETDEQRVLSATGCEIDDAYGRIARSLWTDRDLEVVSCDFADFASDPARFGMFSLLCTNPPYVRHHHLNPSRKQRLQALVVRRLGLQPSGLSGLYVYFVLLADALLMEGGVATWLLPAEFLYVNYGRVLREYLASRVTLLSIHQFDPEDVQFEDALVSSCVVTYRKALPTEDAACALSFGGALAEPAVNRRVPLNKLRSLNKWTMASVDTEAKPSNQLRLKDLVTVRRGIATGANGFFILDKETVERHQIPRAYLKPILPSPRYVSGPVIEVGEDGMPRIDGARYLLDCTAPPDVVKRDAPGLWAYLEQGVAQGVASGFLCAQREVWYFQERREPAPFIASYMGRSRTRQACPIRFFVNFSSALVTNVFLNLYPSPELQAIIGGRRERMLEFANALNAIPAEAMMLAGRAYGGGLHKIEPKELREVPLASVPEWLSEGLKNRKLL